jgi:hypothetical protein
MSNDAWITAACALIVAFYAMQRYDTPATNRLTTTRRLFIASGAGYVLATVFLYLGLAEIVLTPGVLPLLGLQNVTELLARYTAPPILAAVILTTLLPQTPVLKTADATLLSYFQRLGRIPSGIAQLADQLTLDKLPATEAEVVAGRDWITRDAGLADDLAHRLTADPRDPTGRLFTALLSLHRAVEALSRDPAYRGHFRRQAEAWRQLQAGFQVFSAQSLAFFVMFDQLGPKASEHASGDALKKARACHRGIAEEVRVANAEFLARALIAVEPSSVDVTRRLRQLGFVTEEIACPQASIGAFVFLGTMLAVALLGLVIVAPPPPDRMHPALVAFVIAATQTCGMLAAILPKLQSEFFRRGTGGSLPYFGWLAAAAIAFAAALLIDRGAVAISRRELALAWDFVRVPLSPSAPMAAGLALVIGILADLRIGPERHRRVVEGLLAGGAMMLFIGLCIGLLQLPARSAEVTHLRWLPFALSFGLGFVAGLFAPHLYRVAWEGRPSVPETRAIPA